MHYDTLFNGAEHEDLLTKFPLTGCDDYIVLSGPRSRHSPQISQLHLGQRGIDGTNEWRSDPAPTGAAAAVRSGTTTAESTSRSSNQYAKSAARAIDATASGGAPTNCRFRSRSRCVLLTRLVESYTIRIEI